MSSKFEEIIGFIGVMTVWFWLPIFVIFFSLYVFYKWITLSKAEYARLKKEMGWY